MFSSNPGTFFFINRIKTANINTRSASQTFFLLDPRLFSSREGLCFLNFWLEKEIEVCRIDIAVRHDFVLSKSGDGSAYDRFACPAFAAYDDQLFHFVKFFTSSNNSKNFFL